jgi:hypothetical protein
VLSAQSMAIDGVAASATICLQLQSCQFLFDLHPSTAD